MRKLDLLTALLSSLLNLHEPSTVYFPFFPFFQEFSVMPSSVSQKNLLPNQFEAEVSKSFFLPHPRSTGSLSPSMSTSQRGHPGRGGGQRGRGGGGQARDSWGYRDLILGCNFPEICTRPSSPSHHLDFRSCGLLLHISMVSLPHHLLLF
jgi:hypothetical protein